MNHTASPKQLAANRRNAQKSTGPRTPAGLAASKVNAVKHGIFSKELLVQATNLTENNQEFFDLHQRFCQDLNPVGPLEEMLVDQIVTTHWRLRRLLSAESGEIAKSVDDTRNDPDPDVQVMKWQLLDNPIPDMENSVLGNHLLQQWLTEVRASVEQDGELTEATIENLVQCFGGKPNSLTQDLENLRQKLSQNAPGLDPASLKTNQRTEVLAFLDQTLSSLAWRKEKCEERENIAERSRRNAAILPSAQVLDRLLCYESKLERQLFRSMAHLERLRRLRQGEFLPAPLAVEVSQATP